MPEPTRTQRTDDNGRVTMAVLKAQMDYANAGIADLRNQVRELSVHTTARMDAVEEWCTTSKERWAQHQKEHERESAVLKTWSVISSAIAAVAASFVGFFSKQN